MLYDMLYLLLLAVAWPILVAKRKYRKGLFGRTGRVSVAAKDKNIPEAQRILFHAVSVGEAKLLEILIPEVKKKLPEADIIISSTTMTGIETAHRVAGNYTVVRFPLDFSWRVRRFLDVVKPSAIVLIELELWPNLLTACKKRNIPVIVANGRMTDKSLKNYRLLSILSRKLFARIAHVAAQDKVSFDRFKLAGMPDDRLSLAGNIKFDLVKHSGDHINPSEVREEFCIPREAPVLVLGSTREGEEKILLEIYSRLCDKYKSLEVVIAPRHPERFGEVELLLSERGLEYSLKSSIDKGGRKVGRVVLLDVMGKLARAYYAADIAFVGGSLLPFGGQNMLEAAVAAKPIVFGPHTDNFQEAAELLQSAGAAFRANNPDDCFEIFDRLLSNKSEMEIAGEKALSALRQAGGASEKNAEILKNLLLQQKK